MPVGTVRVSTSYAAPVASHIMIPSAGSFVPQPVGMPMQAGAVMPGLYPAPAHGMPGPSPVSFVGQGPHQEPPAPPRLTEGIPDPESISLQKKEHERALLERTELETKRTEEQIKQRKAVLKAQAEQQLQMYRAQVEQSLRQQEMSLDQELQHRQMELQQALMQQRAALEQQATALAMEYQQRKMHEEIYSKQADMHREMYELQRKMQEEMNAHAEQQRRLEQEHAEELARHHEQFRVSQAQLHNENQQLMQQQMVHQPGVPVGSAVHASFVHRPVLIPGSATPVPSQYAPPVVSMAPTYGVPPVSVTTQVLPPSPSGGAVYTTQHMYADGMAADGGPVRRYSYTPVVASYAPPMPMSYPAGEVPGVPAEPMTRFNYQQV